jgi:sporulation protein YlmC with PRC-barrel domain
MKRIILLATIAALATPTLVHAAGDQAPFLSKQEATEWRMANYIGQPVVSASGEKIGIVYDVLFSKDGRISTVVLGVGGFMGMGKKLVAISFETVTYSEKDGNRVIMVPLTMEALKTAPVYTLTEQTTMDKVREKAGEMAKDAGEKASELKDKAMEKIDEYSKKPPKKEGE